MTENLLGNIKRTSPVIQCITNYVTSNDCANILLAMGASPTMAIAEEDAKHITTSASALYLNLGTLTPKKARQMLYAGKIANKSSVPIILDPVGAGASEFRKKTAQKLIQKLDISVIRGNFAEIRALYSGKLTTNGVDCDVQSSDTIIDLTRNFSAKTDAVVICTGETDIVSDGESTFKVSGGNKMMKKVTGAGCMLSGVVSAFVGANPEKPLYACLTAVCAMNVCGETAYENLGQSEGNASYRNRIIDAFYHLTDEMLKEKSRYEQL